MPTPDLEHPKNLGPKVVCELRHWKKNDRLKCPQTLEIH